MINNTKKQIWKTPKIIKINLKETKSGSIPQVTEDITITILGKTITIPLGTQ